MFTLCASMLCSNTTQTSLQRRLLSALSKWKLQGAHVHWPQLPQQQEGHRLPCQAEEATPSQAEEALSTQAEWNFSSFAALSP
jgi:hypothetical protein